MTRITVCVAVFTIGTTLCGASQVDDDAVSKYILSNLAAHPQVRSDGVVQRKVLSIDRIYEWSGGHKRRDFIVYAVVQVTVRESGHTQTWYETPSYRVPDGTTALTPATTAYSYSVDEARYRKGITESDGHKLFRIVYPKSLRQAPPPSKTTSPEPNPKAPAPAPDVSTPRVSLVTVYAAPALRGPARSWEKLSTREV